MRRGWGAHTPFVCPAGLDFDVDDIEDSSNLPAGLPTLNKTPQKNLMSA